MKSLRANITCSPRRSVYFMIGERNEAGIDSYFLNNSQIGFLLFSGRQKALKYIGLQVTKTYYDRPAK